MKNGGDETKVKKSIKKKIEVHRSCPKSVAGYFVGRYNRERRKSLAFLNRSHQECMHSTEGLLFCWLAKAHDVKGAFKPGE